MSQAEVLSHRGFLSVPPRVCWWPCWPHTGYHKLDVRAPERMQGHSVSGMEEMKARCASLEQDEILATLVAISLFLSDKDDFD